MKKIIFALLFTLVTCLVFNLFHLIGTKAIVELSSIIVGIAYLIISIRFFREKQQRVLNIFLGFTLIIAAAFAILPLLFYFLNSFTFVININYNDVLFNYYKEYLNSLIGLILFASVCLVHFILQLGKSADEREKRNYKILISLCIFFIIILSITIARRFGYHISFSRVLLKITVLVSMLLILPYLFYSKLLKQNLFTALFLVLTLTFFNGMPTKYLFSLDFSKTNWFTYDKPVRQASATGLDTLKTINSFKELGTNFYSIDFYGDYTSILEGNNKKCAEESINPGHNCSLFSVSADSTHFLFGRSFDNPSGWKCKTLLCRCHPRDSYASLTLMRMADFGIDRSDNVSAFSYDKKLQLLNAAFWPPDGINEKGLVVAMAAVEERKLNLDTNKAFINCTYLVREMLDHAKDVEEAIAIVKKYNVMNDVWSGTFDQHILIADATGKSVVVELSDGEFRFVHNTNPWQVATNDPVYEKTIAEQKDVCPRFKTISDALETSKGNIDSEKAMNLLKQVGHQYTEWSVVYDISKREMNVAIDFDFNKIYHFSFTEK